MKAILVLLSAMLGSSLAHAVSDGNMSVTGRIQALNEDKVVLETDEAKTSVPRKYLKIKAQVGEKVSIQMPLGEFANLTTVPKK